MQISAQIRFFRWSTSNYPLIHFHIYMIEKKPGPKTFLRLRTELSSENSAQ